jgi:hypothetical protein
MAKLEERPFLTIRDLQKAGMAVVPGRVYVHKEWVPKHPLSLQALHKKCSVFRGSLAEEIARTRDEG